MADLDDMIAAVKAAAEAKGLVCDASRITISFIIERSTPDPGIAGNPQCSLQQSIDSLLAVGVGGESEFAAEIVAHTDDYFLRHS